MTRNALTAPNPWRTRPEARAYLRTSDRTLARMIADGDLPVYRMRGSLRFRQADLDALLIPAGQ